MKPILLAAILAPLLTASAASLRWRQISGPAQPSVEMAADGRTVSFRARKIGNATPHVELAAARARVRTAKSDGTQCGIDVTERSLGAGQLKLWLHVRWIRPDGSTAFEDTFLSPALGAKTPGDPVAMEAFDLDAFVRESEAESHRIRIPVKMPRDGKATVVIDDASGNRVRNVVNALPLQAGDNSVEWDGRREDGTLAAPGTYRVRTATHAGFSYELMPTFGNGGETNLWACYGPNHTAFRSLVAHRGGVSASAFFTEGGNSTDVFDDRGNLVHGWGEGWSLGNEALFHASGDGDFFYSVREARRDDPSAKGRKLSVVECFGYSWKDRHRPDVRVNTPDAKRLPGEDHALRIAEFPSPEAPPSLAGAAYRDGRLYVSDRLVRGLAVYPLVEKQGENRAEIGPREALVPLASAGPVCRSTDGTIIAADGRRLIAVDGTSARPLCTLPAEPVSIAARPGEVFALIPGSHQVHVFSLSSGAEKRRIGEPGGPYRGKWRADRLVNPTSVCLSHDGSSLWVTEERMSPKRLSRWDPDSGRCVYEKLGSESYGSPGAGMDPDDANHWIAQDCEWRLDPRTGAGRVVAVLHPETREGDGSWNGAPTANRTYRWVRRGGRTFVIGNEAQSTLYEYRDSRLVPLAMATTPGIFSHRLHDRRRTCRPVVEAYRKAFPGTRDDEAIHDERTLMLWLDRNGNELIDADELEFAQRGTDACVGYWGAFLSDLDFTITLTSGGGIDLLTFDAGDMKEPGSLPEWSIARAWERRRRVPETLPAGSSPPRHCEGISTASKWFLSLTSDPYLLAFDPQGHLRWHMKNPYPNVHQSHAAPLPVPGELQAVLFAHGSVPLRDGRELVSLMGNHGRVFFVTHDGLFLDELFTDCRVSERADETCVGGEAFGGSFQLDRRSGTPILQAGSGGYRHYRILGTDTVAVSDSSLTVTAEQLEAAERLNPAKAESAGAPPSMAIPRVSDEGKALQRIAAWSSGNWKIELDGGWDAARLYLRYNVSEPSPWTNRGEDPYLMFKTGDCVDMQLGVPGLVRLLVAPAAGGADNGPATVALYRHRVPDSEKAKSHPRDFNSPSRRYTVDDATLPSDVRVELRREGDGHYKVRLAVPLALIGLDGATLAGKTLPADFGVIFGDREGKVNLSRVYWANKETGLVNDVPGEMMPAPSRWGTVRFAAGEPAEGRMGAENRHAAPARLVFAGNVGSNGLAARVGRKGRYGVGPAFDPVRRVVYASSGDGYIAAYRLDGTRVQLHALPDAPRFSRFDTMALADDGTLFVLAGGSEVVRDGDESGGVLFRIPAGSEPDAPAERLDSVGPVNALALAPFNGRLTLHQRRRELVDLDVKTLEKSHVADFRGGGFYLVNAIDHSPDGLLRVCHEHHYIHTFKDGAEVLPRKRLFGPREVSMDRARFIGDYLWTLQYDTVKRFDAATLKPNPGVVHGGSSGAFIGEVAWNHEMELGGIAPVGGRLFAAFSHRSPSVYIMRWNGAKRHLDEVRRIGPVSDAGAALIDDAGFAFADGMAWRVGDSPLAPPRKTGHSRGLFGGAVLPDGTTVLMDVEHSRIVFRHGTLAELDKMHAVDGRPDPAGLDITAPFAGSTVERTSDGYRLVRWDANGRGIEFSLDGSGRVREGAGAKAARGKAPSSATAWAVDGPILATVDEKAGTLTISDLGNGRVLDSVSGLDKPDRVAARAGVVLVHESGSQRLSAYRLVAKQRQAADRPATPSAAMPRE